MDNDYRNTRYCPMLTDLADKKKEVEKSIKKDHRRAKDMHTFISQNDQVYKSMFIEAYNEKCSYCGVTLNVIGRAQFEIDHFIPRTAGRFKTKAQAGYMENLKLSCYNCNRAKGNFELDDENQYKVDPDGQDICKSFYRDDNYYIRISKDFLEDESVKAFYIKLGFDRQVRRLDYLLVNMCGLRDSVQKDKPEIYVQLNKAIELIQKRRW